jgi:hypothetical protein
VEVVGSNPAVPTNFQQLTGLAIAVIDLKAQHPHATGFIPTGWYPDDVAVSPDGKFIAVSTLLGVGTRMEQSKPVGS